MVLKPQSPDAGSRTLSGTRPGAVWYSTLLTTRVPSEAQLPDHLHSLPQCNASCFNVHYHPGGLCYSLLT